MSESNHKKCFLRDNTILEKIEEFEVLDTEQITRLFFRQQKNGNKIAQRRMKKLFDQKKVSRNRMSVSYPYCYYLNKKPIQMEHKVITNWAYIWVKEHKEKAEEIIKFEREVDFGLIRIDGFIAIWNTSNDTHRFYCIETDLSNNAFDKIKKYNELFMENGYLDKWWASIASRFPPIIIITHRPNLVKNKIVMENKCKLEFLVYSIDQMR